MASNTQDDDQQYFILGLAAGVIALVIFLVIGVALLKGGQHAAQPVAGADIISGNQQVAVVTETVVVIVPEGASIRVENGIVNFYFATGSADLAPGAAEALAAVIKGVEGGQRAVISGFHDDTGDAAKNQELAKQRAQMVQEVLVGLGVPADKIQLQKPALTTGTGSNAEARRVEVKLVD
jgi:outer membrane protein OmpA-like peptidoglycan-associated protein